MLGELVKEIKLSDSEKQIVKSRMNGISFSKIELIDTLVDEMILRLVSICGCNLPNTDIFARFIADEISKFILEFGYAEYTMDEILLAFRLNARGGNKHPNGEEIERVQFFGNCLNVDYVARVLENYRTIRNLLDRKIQNKLDGYEL